MSLRGGGGRKPWDSGITYDCDLDFFDKIDSPEKAYWFGFIAADGNLYDGKLQIRLHNKDHCHLEAFRQRIGYSGEIFKCKNVPTSGLIIRRKKLYESLKSLGIEENKTFKIDETIFDRVPKEFKMAAIHGYFDGDGTFSKPKKSAVTFGLVGNESFLLFIKEYMEEAGLISGSCQVVKDRRTRQTYFMNIYFKGDFLKKLYHYFYESEFSSKDFLDRKKKRAYTALTYVKI